MAPHQAQKPEQAQKTIYWARCEVGLCVEIDTLLLTLPNSPCSFHSETQEWMTGQQGLT